MDDKLYEEVEELRLVLGTPHSNSPFGAAVGEQNETLIRIQDDADSKTLFLVFSCNLEIEIYVDIFGGSVNNPLLLFVNVYLLILRERKKVSMSGIGGEREGERESQASRVYSVSTEPDAGLDPRNHEIMT